MAETLTEFGSMITADLRELWRRIAFSIAIHNTDDHLRNHGLLRDGRSGWRLAPAFDINPNPDVGAARVTTIGGADRRGDELTGLMAYARSFRLSDAECRRILLDVLEGTRGWREVALSNNVPAAELSRFAEALGGLRAPMEVLAGR